VVPEDTKGKIILYNNYFIISILIELGLVYRNLKQDIKNYFPIDLLNLFLRDGNGRQTICIANTVLLYFGFSLQFKFEDNDPFLKEIFILT
jgi:hypothetical protein